MSELRRGMIINVDLNPTKGSETGKIRPCIIVTHDAFNELVPVIQVVPLTGWTEKKGRIRTNILLQPDSQNGLNKKSLADCLQTRPIDYRVRLVSFSGTVAKETMAKIDRALKIIFALD